MTIESTIFGVNDAKVAGWNSPENWDTAEDLLGVRLFNVAAETVNGRLEGDDAIVEAHAKIIAMTFEVQFAFKNLDVVAAITGITVTESLPDSKSMLIGDENLQYFGLAGKALDVDGGGGDTQFLLSKCKLMEGLSFNMEYGAFSTPRIQGIALNDGATFKTLYIIQHNTASALAIPII